MPAPDIQYRTAFEFRATEEDTTPGFEGYAAHFWTADSYWTTLAPGAAKKSIKERTDKIPVLWNHDPSTPIGKHLALKEDKTGVYVNIGIADDGAEGSTFLKRMRFGVPFGMSFGFQTIKDRSAEDDDPIDLTQTPGAKKADIRVITEIKWWESSPVTFPANESAGITSTRQQRELDALSSLLDSIRANTLTDEQVAEIEQLVAAYQQRAEAGQPLTSLDDERARRNNDLKLTIALANAQGYLTGALTA
jgi:HK97 family phage prohead protease